MECGLPVGHLAYDSGDAGFVGLESEHFAFVHQAGFRLHQRRLQANAIGVVLALARTQLALTAGALWDPIAGQRERIGVQPPLREMLVQLPCLVTERRCRR